MNPLLPSDPWAGPADPWTRSAWSTSDITYAGRARWETWLALFIAFFLVVSNLALGVGSVNAVVPTALDDAYTVAEGGSLSTVGGTWHLPDWRLRRSITFNNTGRGQLDNFPVLIKLDPADINYARTQGLGQDLRFVDSDGTPLAYEIEDWNTGGSYVWVKVPQIDAGSTIDHIWMYYDNGSAGDGQNPGAVWSEGYVGVWHMDQNPGASQILDSTSYLNHGTASSMDLTNLQTGRVGDGLYFDGSASPNAEYIRVPSDGVDELSISGASPQLTLEAWVRRTGAPTNEWMVVVGRQVGADFYDSYTLATVYNAPDVESLVTSDGATTSRLDSSAGAIPFDQWRYLAAVRNGNNMVVYSNGGQVGSGAATSTMATDNNDVTIAAQENDATADPGEAWRGLLDEIRISEVPRTADWVNAQHASMTDTFGAYGLEEEAGVLANDTDPESEPMTAVLVAGPAHAAVFVLNPDGSFSYTPAAGMSGTDSFTYVANDGTGDSNVATVTITVTATGPNSPPDAVDDPAAATDQDVLVVINVLGNDSDPDPDPLTVSAVTQGANGSVVNNGTDVTYTPNLSWTGVDTFTYEASDGNSGFDTATVTVTVSVVDLTISGTVFEDIAGDVLNDGVIGDANNPGAVGVDVYLYEDTNTNTVLNVGTDTLVAGPVATNASGGYSFSGLTDLTDYFVRVDSKTVPSSQDPAALQGDLWAEQTYAPTGTWCADGTGSASQLVADGPCYGGRDAAVSDSTSAPEHYTMVSISGASVTGVDYGFSHNVVVNTLAGDNADDDLSANRTVQGSLRQFMDGANAISGANPMRFVPAVPANDGTWWEVSVSSPVPVMTGTATTIDGTAYQLTDGATVRNTNVGFLGANAGGGVKVGVDDVDLPQVEAPELEIQGDQTAPAPPQTGFVVQADSVTIKNLAIYGFGDHTTAGTDANIQVGPSGGPAFEGIIVEQNVIGAAAGGFADPGLATRTDGNDIHVVDAISGGVGQENRIRDNLIGFAYSNGIMIITNTGGWLVTGNEIRAVGLDNASGPYMDTLAFEGTTSSGHSAIGNLITQTGGPGIDTWRSPGGHTIENNDLVQNGSGGAETAGLRIFGTASTVSKNVITNNTGPGVIVAGERPITPPTWTASTDNRISQNQFGTNSGIAIDLVESSDLQAPHGQGDGVTLTVGTLATTGNNGLDAPAVTAASPTTVSGTACASCEVEVYKAVAGVGDNSGGTDYGEGVEYLGTANADPGGAWSLTGITALVGGDAVSAIAIDASNDTSEFGANFTVAGTYSISGVVFEDIAGDVLNDGAIGDANNPYAQGVDVYLYDGLDALIGTDTTDASGAYSFTGLLTDTYTVWADSKTVPSAQDPIAPAGDIWAVQTYGATDAPCANGTGSSTARATPGPCYGGLSGTLSDNSTTKLHRVVLTNLAATVTGVDFGFSFNVVVNTRGGDAADDDLGSNRTVQGSLRQFIQNAVAISGANVMRFVPVEPIDATDGGGNDWWSVPVTEVLPTVSAAATTIDGTAYQLTDGTTLRNTNALGPELELNGTGTAATVDGLGITGGTSAVRDLAINRFGRNGILITTAGSNTIAGNYLGTDATGIADLGNVNDGIRILSVPSNTIGGLNPGDRNVISGNNNNGLLIDGVAATGNIIQGNYVGLNAAGTAAIGNTDDGVDLSDTPGNTVGGTDPAARNVIGGQGDIGLLFVGAQSTGNVAVNNYIGTNAAGDAGVPNGTGASAYNGAAGNRIGGVNANEANLIAFNTGDGVWIQATAGANNAVLRNSIHTNGGLGIDTEADGIHINTPADPLNLPVITSATETAGTVTVDFDLDVPDGNYRVEFFTITVADGSGNGEGESFVSSVDVSVTAGVPTPGSHSFAGSVGDILSATATGGTAVPFGATSEFSPTFTVAAANGPPTAAAGGPYSIAEGDDDLALDGSGSSDPDLDALTYRWDLNNDLTYGDVTGVNPTVTWATLQSFGIDDDGGPFTIGLEVDDGNGNTDTDTAQLTVANTPPAISVTGGGSVLAGSPYTVNLSVSDYGDDTVTQWVINWGDGEIETIAGNPATANHTFAQARPYNIVASVTDEDGTWHDDRLIVPGLFANLQLYRLEATTGAVVDNIAPGSGLGWSIAAIIGPDGLLYVGSYTTDRVLRFDPVSGAYLGEWVPFQSGGLDGPAGMAFGPNGNLFVSSNFGDEVLEYDASDGSFVGAFVPLAANGGLDEPDDLTFGPDGNLYVTSFNTDEVFQYNGTDGSFIKVFASGIEMNQPSELVFAKHDAGPWYLYVTSVANDHVARYNGTTGAYIDNFAVAGATGLNQPRGAVFGPDGHLYVGGQNQIIRYNGWTGAYIDTYLSPGSINGPSHSAFIPSHRVVVSNAPPVFDQDLLNRSDPEGSLISLSAAATDPETDPLTYSATGLPLGLSINSGTGLITGLINHAAAASSPYSVEISVTDSINPPVTDTFTWTVTDVLVTIPIVVAGTGGANGGDDLLTNVDETDFDPATNEVDIGTGTGTNSIEAIAVDPTSGTPYAVDGGQFGSLNVDSGVFTPIGTGLGAPANGAFGAVVLDDVRGLAFHPLNDRLYGVHRRAGGEDVLFRIDVTTGAFIPGAFAAGDDYRGVQAKGSLDDVTDIAVDPLDWQMYAVMTDGVTSDLVTVKRNTGKTKSVGTLAAPLIGLSFDTGGQLWGTDTGALYAVDKTDASLDAGRTLDNGSNYGGLAFGVNPALPPSLEGTVFEDLDGNALGVAEGPDDVDNPGLPGVSVHLYRDLGVVGVPEIAATDTLYDSTVTGPAGHYFFSEIPVGPYWIVVDSTSIAPVAGGTGWAEQTYAPVGSVIDPAYTLSIAAGPLYGGMQPTVSDDFNASGLTAAEHLAYHDFVAAEVVEDIDFGFSFNVVTNLEGADASSPQGSLRQFITNANIGTGPNPMRFVPVVPTNATAGVDNWWSLPVTVALPAVSDPGTTLDGSAFSSTDGVTGLDPNSSGPELELAGAAVGNGLEIAAGNTTVRDLIVNRFVTGIAVLGGDGSIIAGNYLGPDATGLVGEVGNSDEGILVFGATNTVIGGTNLADRNIISGNRQRGINVDDLTDGAPIISNGTQILGNYIGTNATGSASLPYNNVPAYQQIGVYVVDSPDGAIGSAAAGNLISGNAWYGIYMWGPNASGNDIQGNVIGLDAASTNPVPNGWESATRSAVYLSNAPGNLIGGVAAGTGNVIASNSHFGVIVLGAAAVGNSILGNQIYDNGDLGIDLASDGVTLNDLVPGDPDAGPNDLLNFPVTTAAVEIGGVVTVDFDLDVPAGDYRIEFFTNSAADPSDYGEGETFAGSYDVIGHAGGPATYRATVTGLDGDVLTATTTEETGAPFGSTSEFSEAFTVIAGTIVVNSTGDDSDSVLDGVCYTGFLNTGGNPECTLRAAIEEANAQPGADTILFDIPITESGYSASPLAFTLNPASQYDAISGAVTIDATTQAGWVGDPIIQLDGTLAVGATAGLVIEGSDSTIAGFIIHSFPDEGLEIDGIPGTGDNNTLRNNWVGVDASGTVQGNTDNGILITDDASGNVIGGTGPFDGNVIAGSGNRGINIRLNSVGNTVIGNSIYNNTQLGIDLDQDGVTENDLVPGDPDSGSNDLLNFPVITSATEAAGTLTVDFDLDVPAGDYRIELFINSAIHPTGNGEGETFAGSFDVVAHPGTGPVSYSTSFAGSAGDILTATTTEEVGAPFGSTSEFSDAFTVNRPPVLDPVGDQSVDELVQLSFTATASDPDVGDNLLFSLSGEPAGALIDPNSGVFTWTPTEAQGPGSYTFDVVVTDDGTPNLADSESITVTVNEVNVAPVLAAIGDQAIDELVLLSFTASATDADLPANGLLFSLSGEPAGASIDPNSGAFTWTPTEAQGPGSYTFSVTVTDDGTPNLADSESITVTVNEVNVPPVLAAIGNQTVDEQTLLTFTASATDADLPANALLFSLSGEPAGALIDPVSGVFTWTPAESQGPGSYSFDVNVIDGVGGSDSETITVTVNEVNVAPVLAAIGDQTVDEQTLLTFTASATDADLPANGLLFSLSGEPAGASIDPNSGVFTWTPTEAQGPNSYTFSVVVTDNGTPNLADSESITVTVNEVNVAPVLAAIGNQTTDEQTLLTFTATATDADLPANGLLFSLSGEPAGALIDPNSGVFTWTPTEAQGPGSYTFSVVVTDDGTPNLADSESITVTVGEVNVAPVVTNPGDQTDAEGSVVSLAIVASDADVPANGLGYGAVGLPPGLSIDPVSGLISGTVAFGCNAGSPHAVTVTVTDNGTPNLAGTALFDWYCPNTNQPPTLNPVGDQTVDELVLLTFTATASDPDIGDNLLFSLSGEPAGALIDPNSGVFTWTPTEAQGPNSYTFSVVVTDDGTPVLNDSESITVTVNEVNVAPVLAAIGNQTVDEQTLLTFTASATDADLPANSLLFSLVGEPAGASIDPNSGVFTWTPTETQGPGPYTFSVVVTDNGTPVLNDSESITVTVNEVNVAPVLAAIGNQTVDEQTLLTFTASATDADLPANGLLFSLSGEPAGAAIDPNSGVFTWTPTEAQGPNSYTFSVVVTDNGTPNLNDSESITVTVNEVNVPPVLAAIGDQTVDEQTLLTFTASATDADLPANGLLFSLSGEPAGALIDPVSGVFTWTPTEAQGPGSYTFDVNVIDGAGGSDGETITVTVGEVNVAPVVTNPGDQTDAEGSVVSLAIVASDADVPANGLGYGAVGLPPGLSIDPVSGLISGTVAFGCNAGSPHAVTVTVTDNGTPNLAGTALFDWYCPNTNQPPTLNPVGDQTVDELVLLTFTATASDPDIGDNLLFSLSGEPAGALIDPNSGVFTWTPTEAQGPNSYTFSVVVTDDGTPVLNDSESITVTVNEVNVAPVLAAIGNQTVDEQTLLTFTASATDADLPANSLLFSLVGEPAGASIDPNSGVFTWTPTETQGPGPYTFSVVVTDNGTPVLNDSESITVTVNEVNVAPVLAAIGNQTVDEQTLLTFTASATDADLPANGLLFSLSGEPAGAAIDPNSGVFTWTPTEAQGPNSYTFSVVVTDNGTPNLNDSESITVTVNEVNVPPVLAAIGDQTVDEQTLLTFTASATDADLPANGLLFSLSGEPAGALIDPVSGVFTWTPTEAQGPGSYTFDVNVIDGAGGSDGETITVTVNEINMVPVLNPVGPQGGGEGSPVTFTASAVDPDIPTTLNFTLIDGPVDAVPPGASIGLLSGAFAWTPSEAQGPGVYEFYIRVTDNTALFDQELVTFTITEVNVAPVLNPVGDQAVDELAFLTFTASASDADVPANGLLFSLVGEPAGGGIDPNSGVFTWTPTEAQGPGSYTFDVVVTDDGAPNLADSESITVTVGELNVAPVLAAIGNQTVDEQTLLTFTASATDGDVPANGLLFSLSGEPAGASIDPNSGVFTWTPTEAQGPNSYTFSVVVTDNGTPNLADSESITVTVNETNVAPVLAAIGNQTVDEQTLLTFTASATDGDVPANSLLFSLSGEPAGASIDPNSGAFTWTPTEAQGPNSYTFSVVVTDNGTPVLNDSETITVTVNEVNVPPVLAAIGDQTVDEQTLLTFTATATDADLPANGLLFSLSGEPAGALIDPVSGVFSWTPAESQGPGSYTFGVNVIDGAGGSDSETITVTVNEVNIAPVLNPIGNQTVDEQVLLTFTATATDSDLPANGLTFSLAGEPAGAIIDPVSGVFTWTPSETQGPGVFTLDVTVVDGGAPAGTDSETITITVNEVNVAPALTNPGDQTDTENDPVNLTILAVDADVPANTLTWSAVGLPDGLAIGPLTGTISGTITYDAAAGSPHVVTVTATDNGIPSLADNTVFIWNVIDLNRPPIALDDAGSVAEDLIVTIDVLGNDSDPDLDGLAVSAVTQGLRGSVTNNGTDITYMPDLNWNGTDTFTYTATDGRGGFDTATVTVVVTPVNDNPVANPDSGSGLEDVPLVIAVLTNDTDIDGDSLAVISVTPGTNGSVTTNGTTVTYQTVANWNGTDSFTYTVADGNGGFDTGAVTVTLAPVNDAPVAVNDAMSLNEDGSGSVSVLANDFDVDGDPLNLVGYTNPTRGTLTHVGGGVFVYNPDPNFFGVDTFTYTAGDGTLNAGAAVTVTVVSVNDAPVAAADSYTMVGDTVLDTALAGLPGVLANDSDVEGGPLSAVIDSGPGNGTVVLSPDGSFVYTPAISWFGTDSFIYHASDGVAGSAPVTAQIVVDRPNRNPVAVNDQYTVDEGDTLTVGAPGVLGNDSDPDTDLLTAVLVTPPSRGTLTLASNGSFVYRHTAENAVDDSFTYVATDSRGGTSLAVVIIRVVENLAPVVGADLISIDEDTVGTVDLLNNDFDPEGASLTIVGIEQPLNGSATLASDGTVSFVPSPDWFGTTIFAYLAGDGRKSTRGLVTVVVAAVNDAPVGGRDSYRFTQYGPATLDVLANDSDVDGDTLSVVTINGVEHALAEIVDGRLIYNAHSEWLGTETFSYTLSDGQGAQVEVAVSVTLADEALTVANELADEVGVPDVPFDSPEASPAAPSISLGSPKGVSLLAGAFFDSFDALKLPLGFLLIALLWALIFGGLFSSPWFVLGGRRRFWSIVLVDRESMISVHSQPDFDSTTVYNYPPSTQNIRSTGAPKRAGNTLWMPVDTPNGEGWMDAYYLTQEVDDETFARDKRPAQLAARFVKALTAGNARAVQRLVSPRGLAAVRFGTPVVVPRHRLKALLSAEKEPGWWRSDPLTAMEALFPEKLAKPFLSSYWAGNHPEQSGKVATLLVPAEVRNFHRFTYSNAEGTWWLLFEYRKNQPTIAGIALAE